MLFYVWEDARLTELSPLVCSSATWGQFPVFSHPELPWGSPAHTGGLQSLTVTTLFTDMAGNISFLKYN